MMTCLAVPALVINTYGNGTDTIGSLKLTSTMLGHVASASDEGMIYVPFCGNLPKDAVGLIYSLCDVAACLLFVAAWAWARSAEEHEDRAVDRATVTADDYSAYVRAFSSLAPCAPPPPTHLASPPVLADADAARARAPSQFPWVPHDTTEEDVRELISRAFHLDAYEYDDAYDRGGKAAFASSRALGAAGAGAAAAAAPYEPRVAEVHVVQDHMDIVRHYVERGRVFRQLERIADRVRRLEDKTAAVGPGCCSRRLAAARRLRQQRETLKARADLLSGIAAAHARDGSVAAFVTFDRQEDAAFFISRYPESLGALFCQREQLQLRGRAVRVTVPPDPSGIIWANLNVGFWSQVFRQAVTGVLTAVMLIGSFLLLWFAAWQQQQFSKTTAVVDCTAPAITGGLLSGAINATSVLALGADDPRLYCYCATHSYAGSPAAILAVPVATLCPSFSCPALLTADPQHINTYGFCVQWAKDRGSSIGLVVAAALSVLVINNLLALFMRLLTDFEGHHSYDSLNASLALRLFFAQFFNTGVLMVVINASSQPLQRTLPSQFKTGQCASRRCALCALAR